MSMATGFDRRHPRGVILIRVLAYRVFRATKRETQVWTLDGPPMLRICECVVARRSSQRYHRPDAAKGDQH